MPLVALVVVFLLLTAPLAAEAQAPAKVPRIGWLLTGSLEETAKALGLTIPLSLLQRADEVIQ